MQRLYTRYIKTKIRLYLPVIALCNFCSVTILYLIISPCIYCSSFSSGTYASAMGKYWHVNHLLCSRCDRALGGDGSFRMDEGDIICRDCFEQNVAKVCAKCGQAILSVSVREYNLDVNVTITIMLTFKSSVGK